MDLQNFISEVSELYATGNATESSYRPSLARLLSSIDEDIIAINEPKRVACGAPDFIVNRGEITIGYVEAKDVGKDLTRLKGHDAEQKERFLPALPNLIYTNCLDFEFYRNGTMINQISIADYLMGIQPKPHAFEALKNHLLEFASRRPQTITSSMSLAEIMAGKASLIKDILKSALEQDEQNETALSNQYLAFREHLMHDIARSEFADIYAETIAYGMFSARLQDETLGCGLN